MVDHDRVQILLGWCLGTSAAVGAAEAISARYFVHAGIEISVAENISVDMRFVLHLEEKGRRRLVRNWPSKIVKIGNAKRLQTDLREEAYESTVRVSELGCTICGK